MSKDAGQRRKTDKLYMAGNMWASAHQSTVVRMGSPGFQAQPHLVSVKRLAERRQSVEGRAYSWTSQRTPDGH